MSPPQCKNINLLSLRILKFRKYCFAIHKRLNKAYVRGERGSDSRAPPGAGGGWEGKKKDSYDNIISALDF